MTGSCLRKWQLRMMAFVCDFTPPANRYAVYIIHYHTADTASIIPMYVNFFLRQLKEKTAELSASSFAEHRY